MGTRTKTVLATEELDLTVAPWDGYRCTMIQLLGATASVQARRFGNPNDGSDRALDGYYDKTTDANSGEILGAVVGDWDKVYVATGSDGIECELEFV